MATFVVCSSFVAAEEDKYLGWWILSERVSDPDNLIAQGTMRSKIEKVNEEYYRVTSGNGRNHLLVKVVNDSTLYSNYMPEKEITILYKKNDKLQITMAVVSPAVPKQPAVSLWERVKE